MIECAREGRVPYEPSPAPRTSPWPWLTFALIVLVAVDIFRVYGSPKGFVNAALESVAPVLPARFRPRAAA